MTKKATNQKGIQNDLHHVRYLPSKYPTVEALLERADGDYPNGGKKEGIVVRPTEPIFCPLISTSLYMKIVSNKYLLKNE